MNWLGKLLEKLGRAVVPPLVELVVTHLESRTAKPDPKRAPPVYGRKHSWNPYFPGASLQKRPIPVCDQCGQERTDATEFAACPGPPPDTFMK